VPKPISELGRPALGTLEVAAHPTPGQGVALGLDGLIPPELLPSVGGQLARETFESNVSTTTHTEAAPLDIVSSGVVDCDGEQVLVEFYTQEWAMGGAANSAINLWVDGADEGRIASRVIINSTTGYPVHVVIPLTPAAGSHTFVARLWTSAGSNSVVTGGAGGAGADRPGYIRVSKG